MAKVLHLAQRQAILTMFRCGRLYPSSRYITYLIATHPAVEQRLVQEVGLLVTPQCALSAAAVSATFKDEFTMRSSRRLMHSSLTRTAVSV